jgi:hypothetical protein
MTQCLSRFSGRVGSDCCRGPGVARGLAILDSSIAQLPVSHAMLQGTFRVFNNTLTLHSTAETWSKD